MLDSNCVFPRRAKPIPDSTFIRWHLEKKYGIDFDRGLDARDRATAWALKKR